MTATARITTGGAEEIRTIPAEVLAPLDAASVPSSLTVVDFPALAPAPVPAPANTRRTSAQENPALKTDAPQEDRRSDAEKWVAEADRGFYVARRNGLLAAAASLWIAVAVIAATSAETASAGLSAPAVIGA